MKRRIKEQKKKEVDVRNMERQNNNNKVKKSK